jgi:hypothetical protein
VAVLPLEAAPLEPPVLQSCPKEVLGSCPDEGHSPLSDGSRHHAIVRLHVGFGDEAPRGALGGTAEGPEYTLNGCSLPFDRAQSGSSPGPS